MIDLGDVVHLSITITNSTGTPADAGAVTATVTLPDNSTATPAVSHDGVGLYSIDYPTVQAGHHKLRWVATGANAATFSDVFDVAAADARLIISLAEARTSIGLPATATVNDSDLRGLIAVVTPIMEDICGPILPTAKDEWHDGGSRTVRLLYAPIISVTAVQESYGNFTRTLTAQPLDGTSFDAYGYTVDLVDGILQRRITGRDSLFQPGRRNIHVTYTAGRTAIGPNITYATRRLVRHLWQQEQQGFRPDFGSPEGSMVSTPSGFLVPHVVVEACGADARVFGLA